MRKWPKALMKTLLIVGILAVLFLAMWACSKYTALIRNPADFFESVTDVRVKIKEDGQTKYFKSKNIQNLRYCYGMKIGGLWFDVPSEFFDLHKIEDPRDKHKVVFADHVVQIGDFVVIAIKDNSEHYDMVASDTLHTAPLRPLESYADKMQGDSLFQYTDRRFYESRPNWHAESPPVYFVYFIIPADALTEDYELTYSRLIKQEDGSYVPEIFVLTGLQITEILK